MNIIYIYICNYLYIERERERERERETPGTQPSCVSRRRPDRAGVPTPGDLRLTLGEGF